MLKRADSITTATDDSSSEFGCNAVDFTSLPYVHKEDLSVKGAAGQELRLKLLSGSNIVFFGAGYHSKRFVYERAAQLGVNVIIVDEPDSWVQELVVEGVVQRYIPLDINQHDHDKLHADAVEALSKLDRIDGICTVWEISILPVARLCEEFGLPGCPVRAIELARDKQQTRNALDKAGLPGIRHRMILSQSDLKSAADHVGFPAVLKPVSGCASMGVQKVSSMEDLISVYQSTLKEFSDLVFVNGTFVHSAADLDHTFEFGSFMLEEYLDGPEVDIDMVMSDGVATYVCVHDNGPTLEPHFNETWDLLPSALPSDQVAALEELAVNSVLVMGFTKGVFHVEAKYTSRGPRLIEVNARMGGGTIHMMHKEATGVDLVDEQLLLAVGMPSLPAQLPKEEQRVVACATINALKSGTISDLSFARKWDRIEGVKVLCNSILISEGDKITGPEDGLPTWLTDLVFSAPSNRQLSVRDLVIQLDREVAEDYLHHYDL
ncbi:Carnosine synthase 1 [Perkinsus olseni]|uniref:Carnosine synthase 1 n=1 Tax=Perkinsus olseni TaxID=32597 RepID=A0A7J6MN90_PEROL|nr:Carnosine synthase 1 [Perkinsus olseni]KAF4672431.1 Carnosine synthase 1 [Perkinsus olseni]